jgi:hypothetical protein
MTVQFTPKIDVAAKNIFCAKCFSFRSRLHCPAARNTKQGPYARSVETKPVETNMVRVENPKPGTRAEISVGAAEALIRMTGPLGNAPVLTARGYDAVDRIFHREAIHLPLIQPEKMIREEKSSRDWSFRLATRGSIARPDTRKEVEAIRAKQYSR